MLILEREKAFTLLIHTVDFKRVVVKSRLKLQHNDTKQQDSE